MIKLFFILTISVISLVLSGADENNTGYQCQDLHWYNATMKGEITSPFYYERDIYHNDLWCEYIIRAPEGNRIKISFKAFDITPSDRCNKDVLNVFSKGRKKELGRLCGREIPKPIFSLPGENEIGLLFITDYMVSGKGFVLMYESVPNFADEIDTNYQCQGLYEYNATTKGEVTSPFYYERDGYHNGLWCEYRIIAPEGNRIKISFKALDITPSYACTIDILSVSSKDRKKELGRFCGKEIPRPLLSLPGESEIRLLFRTNSGVSGKGFVLMYESGPNLELCDAGLLECKNRNCYDPKKKCDGVDDCGDGTDEENCNDGSYQCHKLYEYNATTKGEVTSPFYYERDTYHDGLWCEYRIRAPEGYRIKISFKAFDISPSDACQDSLFVYSKDKKEVIGRFCGTEIPRPLLSLPGESEIRLFFQTDLMVSGKGFILMYESGPNLELCENGLKECRNRNCYDPRKKCNGDDDCGDGTDEEDCGFLLPFNSEFCGRQIIEPKSVFSKISPDRIVGGDIAVPNSWPWQVSLQTTSIEPNGHLCGGFLINAQWVVTAAHCTRTFTVPEKLKVVLGAHHKYNRTKYEQIRYAGKIISYPDLEGENVKYYTFTHDISVIKLNAPVKFNDGVQPACLPSLGMNAQPGWQCYVTGWGLTKGSGGSEVLKQHQQVVQPLKKCGIEGQPQICIEKNSDGTCYGDSGGPLQCKLNEKWFVFGVVSYGIGNNYGDLCTIPEAKISYADVAAKADWINILVNKFS